MTKNTFARLREEIKQSTESLQKKEFLDGYVAARRGELSMTIEKKI